MAAVAASVTAAGGKLEVTSVAGCGTIFKLRIPKPDSRKKLKKVA